MTCTEERFLSDVANHEMRIDRDDGLSRELKFRNPEGYGSNCWFEIITWPGRLCINGDHGCYVFSRISDMFKFFRHNGANADGKPLYINDGYWAEKLVAAASDRSKVRNWSDDKFERIVKERFVAHIRENMRGMPNERRELREAIESEVLAVSEVETDAISEARDFDMHGLNFEDVWEWDCTEWNFHFIWCLYAIVWGIQQYDKSKADKDERASA
jgi:hypothetical protein